MSGERIAVGTLVEEIGFVQDHLALKDWHFLLADAETPEDEYEADIACTYGRKSARIRVGPDLYGYDRARRLGIIAHELLHAHFHHPQHLAESAVLTLGSTQVYGAWHEGWKQALEYAIDGVADALAPMLMRAWEDAHA